MAVGLIDLVGEIVGWTVAPKTGGGCVLTEALSILAFSVASSIDFAVFRRLANDISVDSKSRCLIGVDMRPATKASASRSSRCSAAVTAVIVHFLTSNSSYDRNSVILSSVL